MDGWVPNSRSLPPGGPGDGAFERFLTAAIAAIITIMFSWRLLDDMNEDSGRAVSDEESRKRRAAAYAAIAPACPPQPAIAELDIDEDEKGDMDVGQAPREEGDVSGPFSYDSGYQSSLWGRVATASAPSSSVDQPELSSVEFMKCFTSAPPVYLPTADSYDPAPFLPGNSSLKQNPSDRDTDMMEPSHTSDDGGDMDSDRELLKEGTTCVDWPPDNADDFYNVSGDSDDVQPRELDSDEELYCCSLLEPIIEEDSDDFLSSSADSDFLKPPSLPVNPPPPVPSFTRPKTELSVNTLRSPPPTEMGHLSKQSPQAVVEDVFNLASPLIPGRADNSSSYSADADDSESDESVQTVIRLGSVPSSREGSVESSPLHGPRVFPSAPESPLCEKRLSSPKRYGGGSLSGDVDSPGRVYPETADDILLSVYEANHQTFFPGDRWKEGQDSVDGGQRSSDTGGNSSEEEGDNDSTIDNLTSAAIEAEEGEVGRETSTPVVAPLRTTQPSANQPQAPAVRKQFPRMSCKGQFVPSLSTEEENFLQSEVVGSTDTQRKPFTEEISYVETDLDDFEWKADPERPETDLDNDMNMAKRPKMARESRGQSSAIDSFLTEFDDEPFARRIGRRDRSPKRDYASDNMERRQVDHSYMPPAPHSTVKKSTDFDAKPDRRFANPHSLVTDLDEEPFIYKRRAGDSVLDSPDTDRYFLPSRDSDEKSDTDKSGSDRETKAKADPFLVELEEEPFARRRGVGSRKSAPVGETDARKSAPVKMDDRLSTPLQRDTRHSAPVETKFTVFAPEETDIRKSAAVDTYVRKSTRMETDLDEDTVWDVRGRDTDSDRDSSVARRPDPFLMELEEKPFARRGVSARYPRGDSDLNRSGKSDTGPHRALNDSRNDSDRDFTRKEGQYGRERNDLDSDTDSLRRGRLESDFDVDSYKESRDDSDPEKLWYARGQSDPDRSVGRKSDNSIDPFLTELDEEPFARRVGRRRASPDRTGGTDRPQSAPPSMPSVFPDSTGPTCTVLEFPTVSKPLFVGQAQPGSSEKTVVMSDSPTISMPTAAVSSQSDTRLSSTPHKPDWKTETEGSLTVPESPTISAPVFSELGPQARMSYSIFNRINTSAVVKEEPSPAAIQQPPAAGPFADAVESSAVEKTPRGYTFTRCESESTRSERRIFLVDKPFAPDFETFINSIPFTSEAFDQSEDDPSTDFDEYSKFVQNLHRPSCSGAELSAALPLKSPAVDDRCILSGNLVSPAAVDAFQFPQTHPNTPAGSTVPQNMFRADSAEVCSDSEREKSSKAEASSGDVLDVSFDIDDTAAREKMETDLAFLQTGNTVSLPRRQEDRAEPREQGSESLSDEAEDHADDRADRSADSEDRREASRRRRRDDSGSRYSGGKRRRSNRQNRSDDRSDEDVSYSDNSKERIDRDIERTTEKPYKSLALVDDEEFRPGVRRDELNELREERRGSQPEQRDFPGQDKMTSESASDALKRTEAPGRHLPAQSQSSARLEEAPPILFFQPAALIHGDKKHSAGESTEPQPGNRPYSERNEDTRKVDDSPVRTDISVFDQSKKPEKGEEKLMPEWDSAQKEREKQSSESGDSEEGKERDFSGELEYMDRSDSDTDTTDRIPETGYDRSQDRREETTEVSARAEVSPPADFTTETSAWPPSFQEAPRPKPRLMTRPTPIPRSKSLGDNVGSPSIHITDADDDENVFHGEGSDSDSDTHSSLKDHDEEELLFKPQRSTVLSTEDKRPRSLKEIRRMQKSNARPMIAPFTLPDHMILPSRLKIMASRRQFLSSENLDSSPNTSLQEQFAAHKTSQQQTKERLYKSPNKRFTSPSFSSQDQLEKLNYMLNYSRQSESSFDRSLVDHLHEGCILTPEGRRSILDKTLSIDNLQLDLSQHLRRFGSVTSLVETDIDTGETLETNFFPETNLDIFDHLFQSHQPLQRSASMSDLVLNEQGDAVDAHEPRGRGLSLGVPSHTHKSTGKGRFAHRKHQKSKSLCTLETNLDEVGEEGEDNLRRVPSVHELRVTKSLQKLNVPDWFKQSSLSKSSSCLLKYGSSSTMNSFSFSPSLISSPCASTAPPAPNVVIKTRVVPPSNARALRSPSYFTTLPPAEKKLPPAPVKLPSEKLREKEKNKNLMPIPIVPFAEIRAMFEKKGKRGERKDKSKEESQEAKPKMEKPMTVTTPAVPSISIITEEERREEAKPTSTRRSLFDKPPISPTRTSPPVVEETFQVTISCPASAAPPAAIPPPSHRATNGVRDDVEGNSMSSSVLPRTDQAFPPSTTAPRPHPVTEKPPISPTRAEPKSGRELKDNARRNLPKDSQKDSEPKSPPKDSKQQFSPARSLRQFFGRSKDKSSDKKSDEGGSLDSSFSSGDGVYEKEPRRLGVSEISRRFESTPSATSTSFDRGSGSGREHRSDLDSSFSSGEGLPSGRDSSSRSLEGASSRSSRTPQAGAGFPGSRPLSSSNSDRHQPPFARFGRQEDDQPSRTAPGMSAKPALSDPPKFQRRLPGEGTSFGHVSPSAENGEPVPEPAPAPSSAAGEKKSVKETTV